MALYRWVGNGAGTKSQWNDGRNWINGAGVRYAAGNWPGSVANDDILFDLPLAVDAESPAAFNQGAVSLFVIDTLRVGAAYNGTFGDDAVAPVSLRVTRVFIDAVNAGAIYYAPQQVTTQEITINDGSNITLSASTGAMAVANQNLTVNKGNVLVDTGCILTGLRVDRETSINDANLTIATGVTMPAATVRCEAGTVTCSSAMNLLDVSGGTWRQQAAVNTTLTIGAGGRVIWDIGNLPTVYVYGGTLDASQNSSARTIAACYLYQGGTMNLDNGVGNITLSGGNVLTNYGGTLRVAPAVRMTWT